MPNSVTQHDAVIIGAGVCGIYMLHKLLEQGLDVAVLEAGEQPGGTWYWNRYPGVRFDSESYTYGTHSTKTSCRSGVGQNTLPPNLKPTST